MSHPLQIPALSDAGYTPAQIAAAVPESISQVYAILRRERPDRKRAPRARTSDRAERIRRMAAEGTRGARIAELVGCTRQYVSKVLKRDGQ